MKIKLNRHKVQQRLGLLISILILTILITSTVDGYTQAQILSGNSTYNNTTTGLNSTGTSITSDKLNTNIIAEERFSWEPGFYATELQNYLETQSGFLKDYQQAIKMLDSSDYFTLKASQILSLTALDNSINPFIDLTFLEIMGHYVTMTPNQEKGLQAEQDLGYTGNGLYEQLTALNNDLNRAYYSSSFKFGQSHLITFKDGSTRSAGVNWNRATYAIATVIAKENDRTGWENLINSDNTIDSFGSTFRKLLNDPLAPGPFARPTPTVNKTTAATVAPAPFLSRPFDKINNSSYAGDVYGLGHNDSNQGPASDGLNYNSEADWQVNTYFDHKYPSNFASPPGGAPPDDKDPYFVTPYRGKAVPTSNTWERGYSGHNGIDFRLPENTPVKAAATGTVVEIGPTDCGYRVIVRYDSVYQAIYLHLTSNVPVHKNDQINKGTVVGYVSNLNCAPEHVHFSLTRNGKYVDPFGFCTEYTPNDPWRENGGEASYWLWDFVSSPCTQENANGGGGGSVPEAPYGLGVTTVSLTEARIIWGDAATNETGFRVERRQAGAASWNEAALTGANVSFYDDTNLQAGASYEYRARSYNGSGNSGYTNVGWTGREIPVYRFYSQLSDTHFLTASIDEGYYLQSHFDQATWRYEGPSFWAYSSNDCGDGRSTVFRFYLKSDSRIHFYSLIEQEPDPNFWTEETVSTSRFCAYANQVAGSVPVYRLSQKNRDSNHLFTISVAEKEALQASGNWSDEGTRFYARAIPIPAAPYNPGVTRLSDTVAQLSWGDNSPLEEGYKVERMTAPGGGWSEIGLVGNNQVSYTDNSLVAGQTYFYRARSYNSAGFSDYTYPVSNSYEVPVYRFYSQVSTTHYFTANSQEADYIQTNNPLEVWHYEAVVFYGYRTSDCDNKAVVYRFYLKTNDLVHYFTLNETEPSPADWVEEPSTFCAFATQVTGSLPVYQLIRVSDSTKHFYTINVDERDSLAASGAWSYERIAFYALTAPTSINTAVTNTSGMDTGNISLEGTLAHALNTAGNGQTITFVPGIANITLKGNLPILTKGAKLQANCTSPVTINGTDPSASPNGLTLAGNNYLGGVKLKGFRGRALILAGTGNHLSCMSVGG